jgi:subtilisin family serine protease
MNLLSALSARLGALLTGALVVSAAVVPSAWSVGSPAPSVRQSAGAASVLGAPATVTLLTGERVTLRPGPDGKPTVEVRPRDGQSTTTGYSIRKQDGRVSVVPHDVERLVPEVLDPALFDVTGLVEMRYDDAHREDLPVIVRETAGLRAMESSGFVAARRLDSIDATAGRIRKASAPSFGRTLTAARAAAPAKIWLDATVHGQSTDRARPALDASLSQINAPAAWKRGLDGFGVKVAIVDSGIDPEHPALTGKVTAAADFTGEGKQDDLGHGTHVASLVAGNGAGADGARQGVAPGVEVISSKVLNAADDAYDSTIIAGMEWAVSQQADLVNVSLGRRAAPAGPDLLAESVDRLTARSGTLFVVAAGNDGSLFPTPFSINTPGTAASALTVGAVDNAGHKASFSSEGPTWSYRQKPEVSAPGVGILGAKAGARDGDLYVPLSGTSQATPLVTGSAALLLQQHPELTWQQLKARLSSAVDDTGTYTSWSGSGRVNLDTVTSAGLWSDVGVVDFGAIRHPQDSRQTRTVTLSNPGSAPVAVRFADHQVDPDGRTAPDSAVVAMPATLTVPAGGSARTIVTLDPAALSDTRWQGSLDVLGPDGKQLLRLALNAYDEPPMYDVSVRVLDRNGKPVPGAVVNASNGTRAGFVQFVLDDQGRATRRIPPGEYSMYSFVTTGETVAVTGAPDFTVSDDTTVTLDARKAVRLTAPVVEGRTTEVIEAGVGFVRGPDGANWNGDALEVTPEDLAAGRIFVQPTSAPRSGLFEAVTRWRLEPTGRRGAGAPDVYEVYQQAHRFTVPLAKNLSRQDVRAMARVDTTFGSVWTGGLRGVGRSASSSVTGMSWSSWRSVQVPSRRTELLTAGPDVTWSQCLETPAAGRSGLCDSSPRTYRRGQSARSVFGTAMHPQVGIVEMYGGEVNVQIGLADPDHLGVVDSAVVDGQRLALYRDGKQLGELSSPSGFFATGEGAARWRLEHSWTSDRVPTSRKATTTWEFQATPPADGQNPVMPALLRLDYDPEVSLDGSTKAWRPLRFDLRVGYQQGAATSPVTSAKLWISADHGRHWTPAPLVRTSSGYSTIVAPWSLLPGRTLSVRAAVTDRAGNSVDQTVLDLVPVN